MLSYPPFAGIAQLEKAARNSPPLAWGSTGRGVGLIQAGLVDLGYSMPISMKSNGLPDGIYGDETYGVVKSFQSKNGLEDDGIVGKNTIGALDAKLAATKAPSPPPKPPSPGLPPSTKHYKIGTADPMIRPDVGSGPWGKDSTTLSMTLLKSTIEEILPIAEMSIGDDAVKHLKHYFGNSGKPYTIDLEGMIAEVPTAKRIFIEEVKQAKKFVERLPLGVWPITSKQLSGGYNYKGETLNWYFAVGGYSVWGKGTAIVNGNPPDRDYRLEFEYHFFDRYNWDKGKSVTIAGVKITDEFMGDFHRQGLAHEYDEIGVIHRVFTWKFGHPIPLKQFSQRPSRAFIP